MTVLRPSRETDRDSRGVRVVLDARPLQDPDAPLTPFAMDEYQLAANAEAEQLAVQADELASQARTDIQRASNYILGVVLFATALFFAGISTKVTARPLRLVVLALGCAVFVGTVTWIASFPVSLSV